jgi:hypothetical protein
VHAQSYVSDCSFEVPCHSLMWKAAFSHEILLDCTVNTSHIRGGNAVYQNCQSVCISERCLHIFLSNSETIHLSEQQITVQSCDKVHMFPNESFAIFCDSLFQTFSYSRQERRTTRSHPVENSLSKRLRTCRKTDNRMNEFEIEICCCRTNPICRFYLLIYNCFFIVFAKYTLHPEYLK